MKNKLLTGSLLLGVLHFSLSYAGAAAPCPPVNVKSKGNAIVLTNQKTSASSVYFLQNVSKETVVIDKALPKSGASAGFSSSLDANHWSAVSIDKQKYPIQCTMQKDNKSMNVDCKKVLVVCVPPNLTAPKLEKGTYWIIQNEQFENFVKTLPAKGISY